MSLERLSGTRFGYLCRTCGCRLTAPGPHARVDPEGKNWPHDIIQCPGKPERYEIKIGEAS